MKEPRFGALSSSVNPDSLSARVTGMLIASSGAIVFILSYFTGVPNIVTPQEMEVIAKQIGDLVGLGMAAYGIGHSLFGYLRSIVARYAQK